MPYLKGLIKVIHNVFLIYFDCVAEEICEVLHLENEHTVLGCF
jgi:hypothetical protein